MMKSVPFVLLTSGVLLTFSLSCAAAPKQWTGANNNDWFGPANWSPLGVPGSGDQAFVQNGDNLSANGADIELSELNLGYRDDSTSLPPFGSGTLTVTNADLAILGALRVGATDAFGGGSQGDSNGTLTMTGGANSDADVSVGGNLAIGAFFAGFTGSSTGLVDIQSGDLVMTNPGLLDIGRAYSGTKGSADGTLLVAGSLSHGGLTVVGVNGVQQSSGNASGLLTVGGQFDGLGGNGLQIGTAGGSGSATGTVQIGNGIVNSNVLVGGGGGDPNATGSSTGVLDVLSGGIHGGQNLSVGYASGPGQSTGTLTSHGGVSVSNGISVGVVNDNGFGIGSGNAAGVVEIHSGDLAVLNPGIIEIGRTYSGTSGSAGGSLTVAGNLSHGGLTVVGVNGVQQSSGNAIGLLTVGGQFDGLGGNGLQIGTAGGSGSATGTVQIGNGIVNSNVLVGGGGGDPNATGLSSGVLDVLSGGIQGGSYLSVGYGSGPGQSTGKLTVHGGLSVGNTLSIGVVNDNGFGIGSGNAEGSLTLVDAGLTANHLQLGRRISGTGNATGSLDIGANLASVSNAMELGEGASIRLAVDGFTRGTQYGAFDTGTAMLDGTLDVMFSFASSSGIFDLIVSGSLNGISSDFDTINIAGLAPGTLYSIGTVVDGGKEIYRLQIGSGTEPVPSPATLACLLAGFAVWGGITGGRRDRR